MWDIVIVGAGVSGAYTAYKLAKQWQTYFLNGEIDCAPPKILILDSEAQVGGRIKSVPLKPALPNPVFMAEMCATRFYANLQTNVATLVAELQSEGAQNLQLSTILASQIPLVTPTYPGIETALASTFSPNQISRNMAIDLSTGITFSTNDYSNVQLYAESIGYTYLENNVNLNAFYADPPLSGQNESRFVHGFQSLVSALIEETRKIYDNAYDIMSKWKSVGEEVDKESLRSRFLVGLGQEVVAIRENCEEETKSVVNIATKEYKTHSYLTSLFQWSSPTSSSIEPENMTNSRKNCTGKSYSLILSDCCIYETRQIVYTGSLGQFTKLQLEPCLDLPLSQDGMFHLNQRRVAALTYFSPHPAFKIYIHFSQPWWNANAYDKFCADPLLNQMLYYSPNVILFYILGPQAETLFDMFVQDLLSTGLSKEEIRKSQYVDNWINVSIAPKLIAYIKSRILSIIAASLTPQPIPTQAQINSADMMIVHEIEQANATPIADPQRNLILQYEFIRTGSMAIIHSSKTRREKGRDLRDSIEKNNPSLGIWYLSGDVTNIGGGWVENCLRNINAHLSSIESLLY